MKVLTREQAQTIDRLSSDQFAIPSLDLMENAGRKSFEIIQQNITDYHSKRYLIVCGGGNNGGDGAVIARYLHQDGVDVSVCYISDMSNSSGDRAVNHKRLSDKGVSPFQCLTLDEWSSFLENTGEIDIVIDAIFGIGFHGSFNLFIDQVVKNINTQPYVISIDIPSGLPADGNSDIASVKADMTITFGAPKLSQVDYPGKEKCGKLLVVDIGFPQELMESPELTVELVLYEDVKHDLLTRPDECHKGDFGHVLIIGGSASMTGAVKHAGQAAYRAGAGLVSVTVDQGLECSYAPYPELMLLSHNSPEQVMRFIENKNIKTILLGCGWGQGPEQESLLDQILDLKDKTLVIDADAINIISSSSVLQKKLAETDCACILTPHLKEFSRLTDRGIPEIKADKISASRAFVKQSNCLLVLKDSVTLTCDTQGGIFYNSTGNNSLAKGGSGDILAGLISGLISSGHSTRSAAILSSYVLGQAAQEYTVEHSSRSAFPQDIINQLPKSFKSLE